MQSASLAAPISVAKGASAIDSRFLLFGAAGDPFEQDFEGLFQQFIRIVLAVVDVLPNAAEPILA